MEKSMVKEYIRMSLENMKENLLMIKKVVKAHFIIPIKIDMRETIWMMSFMGKDCINITMEIIMMVYNFFYSIRIICKWHQRRIWSDKNKRSTI